MYQIQYIFKSKKVHARVLVLLLRFPSLLFSAHLINCAHLINLLTNFPAVDQKPKITQTFNAITVEYRF